MTNQLTHRHRVWAEIDARALAGNISWLRARFGDSGRTRIMAVVKADAYGHGIGLIAPQCAASGLTDFGVASVSEGIALRRLIPFDAAIYLLSPILPEEADLVVSERLIPVLSTLEMGLALSSAALARGKTAEAHLEIDTGIGRSGIAVSEAMELLQGLDRLSGLRVTGLSTHFARADEIVEDAQAQFDLFSQFVEALGTRGHDLLLHADNSPGALLLSEKTRGGLIRPGLLLYGIEPAPGLFEDQHEWQPVLTLRARVALVRSLSEGATISYGKTYTVPSGGGVYANIPIGYGDGFSRRFSSCGSVLIHGQSAPICGRVCMDQLVVDVTKIPSVRAGDLATLIGRDEDAQLTAGDLAALIEATPHELTTCLTARVPRVLVNETL